MGQLTVKEYDALERAIVDASRISVFRRGTGVSIGEYLAQCRVAEAQRLLIATDATTSEIAVRAGFGSTSRLYERFVRDCGMPPAAYRASMR